MPPSSYLSHLVDNLNGAMAIGHSSLQNMVKEDVNTFYSRHPRARVLKPHSSYPSAIHNRATSSKAKHLMIFRLSLTAAQVGNWGVLHVDKTAVSVITRYCTRYHSVMFGHVLLSKHYLHGEGMDALPPPPCNSQRWHDLHKEPRTT